MTLHEVDRAGGRIVLEERNLDVFATDPRQLDGLAEGGAQVQSAYNSHFESVCYHPLFVFNQDGDCLAATLRPGNVHSAGGWDEVPLPAILSGR